jgi:predicted O-linked N-acetylglucosamine transferase (SPINDLY family)
MMMNAGITEGIAWTSEEYVNWGIKLGLNESLRKDISWNLKKSRLHAPLWDTRKFTKNVESAYREMWCEFTTSSG